jgi:SNF2 family DNA or RNA helicase
LAEPAPKLPTPEVETVELGVKVDSFATGWQASLSRPAKLKTVSLPLDGPSPPVVSVPMAASRLKTFSFYFRPNVAPDPFTTKKTAATATPNPPTTDPAEGNRTWTRVHAPHDVVKLEDRLFYVLQPALETFVTGGALTFPLRPFPYQWEGIAFLYPRVAAVLADEMGLGKTMQAISTMRLLLHSQEVRSILLVCPKPLVSNWKRELELWAPEVPLVVIEGDQSKRQWQWQLAEAPLKIANYELLHRDKEWLMNSGRPYDLVILDEAQRIKNRGGNLNKVVCEIPRRRSWALTGTPVENSAQDLVGIFEFLAPGALKEEMKPRAMGKIASEYVLRRTKDKVLTELPPKMFRDADVELTPEQRESYHLAEQEGVLRLNDLGKSITIQHVFELVIRLKQICNFDPATGASAKLERLTSDLEEVAASGRKAIVFSQWVGTLETLADKLAEFHPLQYHGQIPQKHRDGVIAKFREDKKTTVLLISYGAGGVGLNLQFSQYVFLFDRWWNPAIEDQAVNRAHRIGSAGPVTVSRFLAVNTIEQRIDQILREKRELFDTIFSDQTPRASLGLSQQEIFGLFNLRFAGDEKKA